MLYDVMAFDDNNSGETKRVIVQVKSAHVRSGDTRDLKRAVKREKATIGVFLTLEQPTKDMKEEAVKFGFYHSDGWNKDFPKLQILTVEDLFNGRQVQLPPSLHTFKQAERMEALFKINKVSILQSSSRRRANNDEYRK